MSTRAFIWACSLCLVLGGLAHGDDKPAPPVGEFRVVGYLPEYRAAEFDPAEARGITDLIVFSCEPTAGGTLNLSRLNRMPWAKLRDYKTRERVRLILCAGGWGRSEHFAAVSTSPEKRKAFVADAVRVCLERRLDGLDLDWEHPKNKAEQEGYADLLEDLREAFQPHGLLLSVTMAAWQRLPERAFAACDSVQIMAYDQDGRHATFEGAESDVKKLLDAGAPPAKLILGLPFYGREIAGKRQTHTYRELVAKHQPQPDVDEIDGIYFNGPATIRKKTEYALESKLGGVMFWELGQDGRGDQSLLKVIRETTHPSAR